MCHLRRPHVHFIVWSIDSLSAGDTGDSDLPESIPVQCKSSINSLVSLASSRTQTPSSHSPLPADPPRTPSPPHSEIYPQSQAYILSLEARQYEQLMDSHSLHEFMIRHGHTLSSTPEFASYQRVYAVLWPVIQELILQLEGICTDYAVPLAVVDGKVSIFVERQMFRCPT